jgi:hypothetical protein
MLVSATPSSARTVEIQATPNNNPINTGRNWPRKSCTLFIRLPWQEMAYFTGT